MVTRRFAHDAELGQSLNVTGTVGYVDVTQIVAHGTLDAAHPLPSAPHSHVAAPVCTFSTWKCRWIPVDQPVVPADASGCPLVTLAPQETPDFNEAPSRCM